MGVLLTKGHAAELFDSSFIFSPLNGWGLLIRGRIFIEGVEYSLRGWLRVAWIVPGCLSPQSYAFVS